jgi:hypothetical protein
MKVYLKLATAALALAVWGNVASADPAQLAAHLRLTPEEAANLTLGELFAAKRGHSSGQEDDMIIILDRGTPNPELLAQIVAHTRSDSGLDITQISAAKFNRNASQDRRVSVVSTRGVPREEVLRQLAVRAGLTPEEAAERSLDELAAQNYSDRINR